MALPRLIHALLSPLAYPENPASVELCQTHISYILLTPRYAYKIKKPVDLGFLDFTTLEKRRHFCAEEVRLNKRLAPDAYLGVLPISKKGNRAVIGGAGSPVEYAVWMKRFRQEDILEDRLVKGLLTEDVIKKVALKIASFHANAATGAGISQFGMPWHIRENANENFFQTKAFISKTISRSAFNAIKDYTDGFLRDNERLFLKRVKRGFIRDCHGDLHLEHIVVNKGVEVFDAIEFNERFRFSDVISDIAFLSMDMDFHNRHDLSRVLDDRYVAGSGDNQGRRLFDFYKCYRAYVRGKVDGIKSMELEVNEADRRDARISAMRHFRLSFHYATGGFSPELVIISGLAGTGKSTLAESISRATGLVRLSSDSVRKGLSGIKGLRHAYADYKAGMYTDEFTKRTYDGLIKKGISCLKAGRSVILDATFSKAGFLKKAINLAGHAGLKKNAVHVIQCVADDRAARKNLLKRQREDAAGRKTLSDATWEIYIRQKKDFEPINAPHLALNASSGVTENTDKAIKRIFS
ncbi:MAG: AAA family ATPase [Deltaproteobacteria bacterium]